MAAGNQLRVRPMSPADIDFAIERIREAGWASQSREVFAAFLDHDPRGCFIAESGSERVGICVATRYRANAFIGELVVRRDRRILGAGRMLLARALAYLDGLGVRDVFLDGDLNAVPYYESVGFKKIHRSLRFRGPIRGKTHSDVRPLRPADLDGICARDLDFFGDDGVFSCAASRGCTRSWGSSARATTASAVTSWPSPGRSCWRSVPGRTGSPGKTRRTCWNTWRRERAGVFRIGVMESNEKAAALVRTFRGLTETPYCWFMGRGESRRLGNHPALYAIGSGAKG